jgi:TatD DNase family protein
LLGHLVSFTGIISFKNADQVRVTAAAVPADGYMVETDCPYLAPVPYRGKRAEPFHTRIVAEQVALARGITLEEVAAASSQTAETFFRFQRSGSVG